MSENTETLVTKKKSHFREYVEALFTALLVAFFIRSFVIEAFKIPSGSMIPTLVVGDHIFVNKFIYGLRIPFTKIKLVHFKTPERGDPIVFIFPVDESKDFIKRVVGLPGDHIRLNGDDVFVNEQPLARQEVQVAPDQQGSPLLKVIPNAVASQVHASTIPVFPEWEDYHYYVEQLGSKKHLTQFDNRPSYDHREFVVPPDHLFVMGDNRDNSADSREWGFVPMENVKGKAMFIWLSLDYDRNTIRWNRFGKWIR